MIDYPRKPSYQQRNGSIASVNRKMKMSTHIGNNVRKRKVIILALVKIYVANAMENSVLMRKVIMDSRMFRAEGVK